MGYTIPGWLDDVLDFIGINFPNVDEDDYREMATAMREFAEKFEGHGGDAHQAFSRILSSSEGWAVDSMEKHWNQIKASHLEKLPELARLFADACDVLADIIFGMKTKAEIELGVMAASVGISAGLAVVTGGLSALIGAAEVTAMRQVVKRIIDEAVDRIVDEVLAKITEPINAKLESMVEDMVLDLAEGAFTMPPADGSGGGDGGGKHGHGGMHLASAGGGGGGPQKRTRIDHAEFEDGAGRVSRHGGELHLAASSSLNKARGAFGRSKGRDPFTQAFDSVLHGALKGSEKALGKVAKHITDTVPERVKGASRLHKGTDHGIRDKVEAIVGGKHEGGKDGGSGRSGPGSPLKIDQARRSDPDLADRAKDARATKDKETCGDPIDMASGQMVMAQTDVELAGVLPLLLRRTHLSGYTHGRCFGPSWASTLDERLEKDAAADGVWWRREDGSSLYYPRTPDIVGDRVDPVAGACLPLTYVSQGTSYVLVVQDPYTGLTRYFEPSEADEGTWWLIRIEDRNHNHVALERAQDDALLEVSHSGGYRVRVGTAEGSPRITGLHLTTGDGPVRLRGYRYDEAGELAEVRNAVDAPTRFSYDDAHRITGWHDGHCTEFHYAYDASGRVVETRGTDGILNSRITYAGPHQDGTTTATYTDSLGHATTYRANAHGQIVAITDPLGNTVTQTWDARDRLLTRTGPLGHTRSHTYDDVGNLVETVFEDGSRTAVGYDGLRLPTDITLADGTSLRQEYDARGNLTRVTGADGEVTRYGHDPSGAVTSVTDALGHTSTVRNDAAGLPVAVTDPLGATTVHHRDAFGRVRALTDPLGATATLDWSAEGKPLRFTAADGSTESWEWDGEGNCTRHTDAVGGATRFEFGPFDLLTAWTGSDGARYEFRHDTERRLTEVTAPDGLTWSYTYDAAGRTVTETDFDGRRTAFGHDAAGRLTMRTGADGDVIRFERDGLGRTVRKEAGTAVTSFAYGPAGELVRATGPDADLTFAWDPAGRLVAETVNGRTTSYTYDALGRRLTRTTPTGATSVRSYDAAGRVTELATAGRTLAFSHDSAGRELTRRLGDSLSLSGSYDALGRLTRQELTGPAGRTLVRRDMTYRSDGLLVGIDDHRSGPRAFDLDPVGRITGVHAANWSESYAYDAVGNQTRADWPARMPGHDATGERRYAGTRISTAGRVHYEYDAQGRTVVRRRTRDSRRPDVWHYTWDAESRLTRVVTPDGVAWRYLHDPFGRRIAKQKLAEDGSTVVEHTDFVWDGSTLAEQTTHVPGADAAVLTLTWEHEGLRPVSQTERKQLGDTENDSRFFAIVTDLVGAPTELVDEYGSIAWRARATVWGATTWNRDARAHTPLRFPGQYADPETALHYNHFRHYDPETARYVSSDPLGLGPAPNPVTYVHNPHLWADPLGLASEHNPVFPTRAEAFNHARDMAGVPNSAQPVRQWEIGGDPLQAHRGNYEYRPYDPNGDPDRDPRAGWGRYYQYDTPGGTRVIAEHTSDPRADHPHFHAGKPPEGSPRDIDMQGRTYKQIMPKHHIYYRERCNGK